MEKSLGDEVLFLEKPAEDQAREQADEASGAALFGVRFKVGWEFDLRERPEIPVGEFLVEALVEEFDVEDFFPGGVEGVEVGDGLLLWVDEILKGKGVKDVEVAAVGAGEGDITDDGDLAEHVLVGPHFVLAAVEDGDGEDGGFVREVLDEHHNGHGEDTVDLAGNGSELAAGVVAAGQLDGEEEVGAEEAWLDGGVLEETGFAGDFLVGELEEEVGGFPLGEEGLFSRRSRPRGCVPR